MLTLPDFKEKQVLFIRTDSDGKNKIRFKNDNIVYEKDNKIVNQVSSHRVLAVFVVGDLSVTSQLMKQALRHGVSLFFMGHNFRLHARINAVSEGNYLLHARQYSMSKEQELQAAKDIVSNKIVNQLRALRSRQEIPSGLNKSLLLSAISKAQNQESLRGIEGNVAKQYFARYFAPINWYRRMPRVKPDIPNVLLDIGYTMLFHLTDALLRLYGFDTFKGCYHQLFFQRQSLTCDIVEPFRPIIDRELLKMFTLKKVNEEHFSYVNNQCIVDFKHSLVYSQIFMEALMKQKTELYKYVQGFYRFVMNDQKHEFPFFTILR